MFLKYGGAVGSLKTSTAIEAAAQFRDNPNMHSILLRRTAPELKDIMNEANLLYSQAGGRMNWSANECTFPSGSRVWFGYAQRDKDIHRYMGPRFSFINFDESTFFGEYAIRFMFSRLGSVDSRLPLREWLTTNPGGISHNMHMSIFQGKTCIHCAPSAESRKPFIIYNDAVWDSDKKPVWDREAYPNNPMTTCFIPGRLSDHTLFGAKGERYSGLGALTAAMQEAYRAGCWAQFEGQYFDVWNPNIHVIDRRQVKDQRWWPWWTGTDYGFKKSWACSYLLTRSPEGHIYVVREIAENRMKARDFAKQTKSEWFPDDFTVADAHYLSPDCWADRGDDETLADQMMESGLSYISASNDRAGGAMLIYTMLADNKLFVTKDCPLLIQTIPSRIHDEKEPTKVQKVEGDRMDDAYDGFRYGLYSYAGAPRKPRSERVAEAVTSEDPTIQAMQRRVAEAAIEKEEDAEVEGVSYTEWPWQKEWRDQ